jgi:hypothetical protein
VQIEKPANSTNFNITIQINPASFATPSVTTAEIQQCFEKIDQFNQAFFGKHGAKLEIRPRRTLKSASDPLSSLSTPPTTPLASTQPGGRFALPASKNPKHAIVRKFTYEPFFTVDSATGLLTMQLEIKHMYLQRIFQALQGGNGAQANEPGLDKISKEILSFIDQEFFEFKRSTLDMNTRDSLVIPLRFWIKSNMFMADAGRLLMKWKICDFAV